ncbi:MAG: hypothetical protein ACPGU9_06695 [Flavobacteriaceae bacterium]
MKKLIFIAIAILSFNSIFGQQDKIKALKTAHITSELNLSSQEAEKFWPIYNDSQKEIQQLRRQLRELQNKNTKLETLSEQEATNILNSTIDLEERMHHKKKALTQKLKKVISVKKIILLQRAEHQFNRKLVKKFRDRRHQPKGH